MRRIASSTCARSAEGALLVELGVGAQRGQRGAQLVAGVGEEPVGGLLAGLALGNEVLDPAEHPVERATQPADLGTGVLRADPLGQVTGSDLVGLPGHGLDRAQAAPHDPGRAAGREQPCDRRADDQDQLELADRLVDPVEAGRGDEDPAAWIRRGHPPQLALPGRAGHSLGMVDSPQP